LIGMDNKFILAEATMLFREGKFDRALILFEEAIKRYPEWSRSIEISTKKIKEKLGRKGFQFSYPAKIIDVPPFPESFPADLALPEIAGIANDYSFIAKKAEQYAQDFASGNTPLPMISVVIPVYNRSRELSFVLAGLCHQTYPKDRFEVVIADDGSSENIPAVISEYKDILNIAYCFQEDAGYRLAEARNLGVKQAKYDNIVILDSDAVPSIDLLTNYSAYFSASRNVALFGFRHYVLLSNTTPAEFLKDPSIVYDSERIYSENNVATVQSLGASVDWREEVVKRSNNLLEEKLPYRFFVGANCGFTREVFDRAKGFSSDFNQWGFEDQEFAYRLWINGCYFIPLWNSYVYHQEPLDGKNDTDRNLGRSITKEIFIQKCPFIYRKDSNQKPPFEAPLVSIYVPCYNRGKYLFEAIESALMQTVDDLEVCICDDGSTDNSLELLNKYYGNHPRVRFASQKNEGIASASNHAIRMTRGCYVGQLDADDILKMDAVEKCLEVMEKDDSLSLVYGTTDYISDDSELISEGWNWPLFTREHLMTKMIVHHFRLFRRRDWSRTSGFNESMINAVDFDMMLKLAEVGNVAHIQEVLYSYRKHMDSTTFKNNEAQTQNAFIAISDSFARMGITKKAVWSGNVNDLREVKII